MERSLAGVLFFVGGVLLSLAAGGWWMQRILFTPDATRETAEAILAEPDIRAEINNIVSSVAAPTMETTTTELYRFVEEQILTTRAGAAMMGPITREAHDRIIGNRDDLPVILTGLQVHEIVRDQRAATLAPVTLPIPTIGTLKTVRRATGLVVPISAGLGCIAVLLGIFTRPDRRDALRGFGEFAIALAVSMLVFGYLIPVHMLTAIDNSTWTHAMPRLALRTLRVVIGSALIFGLAGAALLFSSGSTGKRRQSSTPLAASRYRGGDSPGWG